MRYLLCLHLRKQCIVLCHCLAPVMKRCVLFIIGNESLATFEIEL